MARFFIDRPIFAWVIAIAMMLAGGLAIISLPVEQYPAVAPPEVTVSATYPGASAEAVEEAVTQVIEQEMNGIDNLLYIASNSNSSGRAEIRLTFAAGTDPDIAQVQVQNKLQLAIPRLPQIVQQEGVQVTKSSLSFLMVLSFVSRDGSMDRTDIADYVAANVRDPVARTQGVGRVQLFGAPYAMRIWLDPEKLNAYGLSTVDVIRAIEVQNNQVAAGEFGGTPSVDGQQLNATIVVQTLLESAEAFGRILVKADPDGSKVRLEDVARVELGAESYSLISRFNGDGAAGMAISLASGVNALDTARRVRERVEELSAYFPEGLEVGYPYDTTPFVKVSIEEVVKTLFEGIALVVLVMLVFLQNFRATLIPSVTVPVVLLGTFAVLFAFGFSINTLTMFAMVLAIGLLVDDAIVVVENVERVMTEEKLGPLEATRKSMDQITGALVGIALVLSAVFVPMAFFPGSTGAIYREFSVTLVSAMVLSVGVALILTPALCATMLPKTHPDPERRGGLAGRFNRGFAAATSAYQAGVRRILGQRLATLLVYAGIIAVLAVTFARLPQAFLPEEDQGFLFTQVQLPVGSTLEQTDAVMRRIERYWLEEEDEVAETIYAVSGFSFAGSGQNVGTAFVRLKPWEERDLETNGVTAVIGRAMGAYAQIREGMAFAFNLPVIRELGVASGFNLELQDRGGQGHDALVEARDMLLGQARGRPSMVQVRFNGLDDAPQYRLDVDREKARAMGVSLADVNETLAAAWGSRYVNDFEDRGRIKRVYVQADAPHRMLPEDLGGWYVPNDAGEMVPFSSFTEGRWTYGARQLQRYNGVPAMNIQGAAAPGASTGEVMDELEQIAADLPGAFGYAWTGLSYQERQAGDQAPALYALSLIVVFLCLAALYESWSIPFAVMLVVPLGILGAVLAAVLRGLNNDIFFQVGLLTTMGLSAKNAILICEFALAQEKAGAGLVEATLEATRRRLRPILMTSLAFMLGVTPLMLSTGAGSGARNALGTAVFGGMLTATVLAIFFIPLFYVLVRSLAGRSKGRRGAAA